MTTIGALRHRVVLDDPIVDGTPNTITPSVWHCSIRPVSPSAFDEKKVTHIVECRYHPGITFNTQITHRDRHLFVRGIQNVDERNQFMTLLCEEVVTP